MQLSLEEKNEKSLDDEKIQKALVTGLVCGFIFMISVIGLVWYCHSRRKQHPSLEKEKFPMNRQRSLSTDGTCNTIHTFHTNNKESQEDRRPAAQDIFAPLQQTQSNDEPINANDFQPSTSQSRFTVVAADVTESPM
ncbi:Oidioi.mRNA.OKI2018_I69.XSR.g15763.t1.cds [Oikopleura dioica]|uniref:Oidioi.mRNA.OKI2018_I69.XSR.g15763.t1.cds n=1 Tax=Oikopleura dioica TaxID=34765 RepID=A0ABN7SDW2_OIKDI|nr:Oidioi.mRNA.OKI2018_I69.XSR.g15763.t1.cds [Oikopleura dioica]